MRVWVDLTNSPHVPIFAPLIGRMRARGWEVQVTARAYAQTLQLLELHGIAHTVVGHHGGGSRPGKARAAADRVAKMVAFGRRGRFDAAVAHGSTDLPMAARALRVPCATMFDYEYARLQHTLNSTLAARVVVPEAIPFARLRRLGARRRSIARYPGLLQEYYLADVTPDPAIRDQLGIDPAAVLVVLRPPADLALYHRFENPFFDGLVQYLGLRGDIRTVVLPRTDAQARRIRALDLPSLLIPERAVDGHSLIVAADLVVSAGGTMNREAAALGTPVYTTFAGRLGAVDEALLRDGRMQQLSCIDDLELVRRPAGQSTRVMRDPDTLVDIALAGLGKAP